MHYDQIIFFFFPPSSRDSRYNSLLVTLIFLVIVTAFVLAFVALNAQEMYMPEYSVSDDEAIKIEEDGYEYESSASMNTSEDYPPLEALDKQKVEAYLGSHINEYVKTSPSVLGGSFYITSIEWYTNNSALVAYEDGHITVKARVTATVDGDDIRFVVFNEFQVK